MIGCWSGSIFDEQVDYVGGGRRVVDICIPVVWSGSPCEEPIFFDDNGWAILLIFLS